MPHTQHVDPAAGSHTPHADAPTHTGDSHSGGTHTVDPHHPDPGAPSHDPALTGPPPATGIPHHPVDVPADRVPPPLHRAEPLPTKDLGPAFPGENDPLNPNRAFYPRTVHYMDAAEREMHRVAVVDGTLHWSDGSILDTTAASTHWSPQAGKAIFVMDRDGNLFVSLEQDVGRLHHSSLLAGQPVAGAGELAVQDGRLQLVTRASGHYRPTVAQQQAVLDELARQGLDVSHTQLTEGF